MGKKTDQKKTKPPENQWRYHGVDGWGFDRPPTKADKDKAAAKLKKQMEKQRKKQQEKRRKK